MERCQAFDPRPPTRRVAPLCRPQTSSCVAWAARPSTRTRVRGAPREHAPAERVDPFVHSGDLRQDRMTLLCEPERACLVPTVRPERWPTGGGKDAAAPGTDQSSGNPVALAPSRHTLRQQADRDVDDQDVVSIQLSQDVENADMNRCLDAGVRGVQVADYPTRWASVGSVQTRPCRHRLLRSQSDVSAERVRRLWRDAGQSLKKPNRSTTTLPARLGSRRLRSRSRVSDAIRPGGQCPTR